MLISAFMGEDWRKLYEEALASDYRFLSYGDSCLLLP
jgi:S-adenosylmethionine:tRNA ribosyltransferase-isomerase